MTCLYCKKEINVFTKRHKFCSDACCDAHHVAKRRERLHRIERVFPCPICGVEVKTWSSIKKYCNMECSVRSQTAKKKEKDAATPNKIRGSEGEHK